MRPATPPGKQCKSGQIEKSSSCGKGFEKASARLACNIDPFHFVHETSGLAETVC
jgi:hypothetical protein